jgi:hypothetical protein
LVAGHLQRVGDVRLDLLDHFMSISRPITAPGWNPSATFIAPAVSARRYNRDHSDPGCDSLF